MTAPAGAQDIDELDNRIDRLEREMNAVQRQLFPGGNREFFEPEIGAEEDAAPPAAPSASVLADLGLRVDALEAQLARLTGQVEENGFALKRLEEEIAALKAAAGAAREEKEDETALQLEAAAAEIEPAAEQIDAAPEEAAAAVEEAAEEPPSDPAEDAYIAGYRLWNAGRFGEAQRALEQMAKTWPRHRRASWARNLAGRAYLDDGKPATAAKILLANYQTDPKGQRAADSLFFLGKALVALGKKDHACKAFAELEDVYGERMRAFLRERLPAARAEAGCP
ncbi:MAG: tol-pal system YbgF family protein [Sphingomonadaceae bacterium]